MSTKTKQKTALKLDLACGKGKQEGFTGVDISPDSDADQVVDLTQFPWPWKDDSVDELFSSHYVEHTPMGNPDGLISFVEECYRILKPDHNITIVHPHGMSARAFQDPTHRRYIVPETWPYFAKDWREAAGLGHYPITTDFGIERMWFTGFQGDWGQRAEQSRNFALAHYWNVGLDVAVVLKARK
jgi:predicted SAM-dependent methyltransferase